MGIKQITQFIDKKKDELIDLEQETKPKLIQIINHVLHYRLNLKRIRDIATGLTDDVSAICVLNRTEIDSTFKEITAYIQNDYVMDSAMSSTVVLQNRIDELETSVKSLEGTNIELSLDLTRSTERITDQMRVIDQLTKDKAMLKNQVSQLTKTNMALTSSNENFSNQLLSRYSVHVSADDDSIDIGDYEQLKLSYTIEYLNQFITTGMSLFLSKNDREIVEKAIDFTSDPLYMTEPLYITTLVDGKVFSRFDVDRCYQRINQNMFIERSKLNKRVMATLMQKELTITNKSVYAKIVDHNTKTQKVNAKMENQIIEFKNKQGGSSHDKE